MKTIQQFTDELREKQNAFRAENRPLLIASSDAAVRMSERIFKRGENKAGRTHRYKTKSDGSYPRGIYITRDKSRLRAGTPPKGKPGAEERYIEDRKSAWFPDYKSYRQAVGLETKRVTYENQGDLRSDFENLNTPGGTPKPKKITKNHYRISITRDKNVAKAGGLEDRYGVTFAITRGEKAKFLEILELEFGRNV